MGQRPSSTREWKTAAVRGRNALRIFGLVALQTAGISGMAATGAVSFNRDIRPILSDHCFACHGPDAKARKADLRFDIERESRRTLKSGKTSIVPGRPEASELIARVNTADADERMPPLEFKKPLSDGQKDLLRRWISEGGRYEGHWAYLPPQRPDAPVVKHPEWPRTELDQFVLARLEREGLQPTPEAPKEKLLRRVTLDLTGLPPTVEEIDAFLADNNAKAYDRVVDRLLASPHYGERMAQQWLDLARYGETQGYHHDRHRDMWHWRDWVIRAFNANEPFDQFTVEQLAGDLLPNPTRDQLIATGFHRNEMTTSEGGALPQEYIVKYAVGRVDTTARVWLGTSMACAECHDHKYDPISQKEYYQFFAFFFDTPENGLDAEELNPVPRITLESAEQRARSEQLGREIESLDAAAQLMLTAPRSPWDQSQAEWEQRHRAQSVGGWEPLSLASSRWTREGGVHQRDDQSVGWDPDANGPQTLELAFRTSTRSLQGLRLEILPGGPPADAPAPAGHDTNATFFLSQFEVAIQSLEPARESEVTPETTPDWGRWSVIGPFGAGSVKEAFEREFEPDKNSDPGAVFNDGKQRWREATDWEEGETVRVAELVPNSAAYLARVITVKEPTAVDVTVKGGDGLRAWLNGRLLAARLASKNRSDPQPLRLWLRPGDNRLLLKLARGGGDNEFAFQVAAGPVTASALDLAAAAADVQTPENPIKGVLDSKPETGWSFGTNSPAPHVAFFRTHEPFGFRGGTELRIRMTFKNGAIPTQFGGFRISASTATTLAEFIDLPEGIRAALIKPAEALTEAQRTDLRRHYRERFVPEVQQAQQLLTAKRKEREDFLNGWPTAMVMRPSSPTRETHFLIRGAYDNPGDTVTPGVPTRLFPWKAEFPANRLGLARWLVDPNHPLTSRVIVNQYWQKYFGAGLVKTSEDFGAQGEWPSHPELLDWLATEFVRSGWNVKALQRLLVSSATYRQDSVASRELLERDPENRLLSRGPRFRLDAENIRDVAMAASGLLNPEVGGPSVFPYQPPGLWGQVSFEGTRDYTQSEGAANYRRGLYTYWRRSIPYAGFTIFDAPSREVCAVRRPRTNTPLQALALMNDPVYVEAARALGHRVMTHGGSSAEERIRYAFRLVLGRQPTPQELGILNVARTRELAHFAGDRQAANRLIHTGSSAPPVDVDIVELAAWTVIANTLLNLDEAISKG